MCNVLGGKTRSKSLLWSVCGSSWALFDPVFCTGITLSSWFLKRQTFSPLTRGQVANYCNMDELKAFQTRPNRYISNQNCYIITVVIWRVLPNTKKIAARGMVRWQTIATWLRRPSRPALKAKRKFSRQTIFYSMTAVIWRVLAQKKLAHFVEKCVMQG